MRTAREKWKPVGVDDLEPAALEIVRGNDNTLVYAGPGAGKTELLAQRACFLLETDACPAPRRILAISFKRDAARNLRERVAVRCGRTLAARFDSYTYEAFSKGLIDRFLGGIPAWCRPKANYRVLDRLNDKEAFNLVGTIPSAISQLNEWQRQGLHTARLWQAFVGRTLPDDGTWVNATDEQRAAAELWRFLTVHGDSSALGFAMIGRLADLLLRTNPLVLSALRKSYHVVFLDEFQDTTSIQYDLVRTAFVGSTSVLTAVGDDKQRIMGWAGAMSGVFGQYVKDFGATAVPLTRNYRSADKLVKIQSIIAKAINPKAIDAVSMDDGTGGVGECRALVFKSEEHEAEQLAVLIKKWILEDGLPPRDICVLCRMKPPTYTEKLREALMTKPSVRSRIENEFQDLLAEPLTECVLDFLKLGCRDREPQAWGRTVSLLAELCGDLSDEAVGRIVDRLLAYIDVLKVELAGPSSSEADIEAILKKIMRFVGEDDFKTANPQYSQGDWYAVLAKQLIGSLVRSRVARDWSEAIDEVEGVESVPIMTTHKSKGLEYHTIVFVGLEDSAHFSFRANPVDETCGFFVAMSRAAKRVIFTFAGIRSTARNGGREGQQRESVKPLYALLQKAGVELEEL